jgi:uncharacterized SAM-binding protein YcdF (DUF218 family)
MMTTEAGKATAPPPRRRRLAGRIVGVSAVLAAVLVLAFLRIHPFLAVSAPVPAKVLVVEGWLPDYAVVEAYEEYTRNGYELIYTTGGPLRVGGYLAQYGDFAHLAAATLERLGMPTNRIRAVPTEERFRNRTYSSAKALRDYWETQGIQCDAINLMTEGTHARRSRFCFQQALGPEVRVGVISVENRDYSSDRWWRYSSGVKMILGETVALLYAWVSMDYGD